MAQLVDVLQPNGTFIAKCIGEMTSDEHTAVAARARQRASTLARLAISDHMAALAEEAAELEGRLVPEGVLPSVGSDERQRRRRSVVRRLRRS